MKTRFLPALMALSLLAGLSACGGAAASGSAAASSASAGGETSRSEPSDDVSPTPEVPQRLFNTNATLAETVLVDEGGVKITATGLTYTAYSAELALTIENNSGKNLSFVSGSMGYSCNSINGYMVDEGYLNCDVADGKKANEVMSFDCDVLMAYGIDEIADMEIGFEMTDDDYDSTYSGPRPLKTSAADTHDYTADHYQESIASPGALNAYGYEVAYFGQDAAYDSNGVTLRSSSILKSENGGAALLLELENTTDSMVYVSASDIKLNGLVLSSSTWSSDAINPGKRRILEMELSAVLDNAFWSAYGIADVGTVSLSLEQYNEDGAPVAQETAVDVVVPGVAASFDATGTEVYNNGGLRIVAKEVQEDPSEYGGNLFLLLLAENKSGKTLTIDDVYDSLSANGFMTDYSLYSQTLADGESAALVVQLWESSLEANQIAAPSDIQQIEMGFEIKEGYTTLDEPVVTLDFGG